ncbi:hypothetical protein F3Y22_tig00113722pilonHSYRG00338 [Hibiscus syriacus]|uniref:Uncharacterized protein n=1 Tax=Hibiscus syriacus TaxID=106335 RepID=A0A6A2WND0_HIBSY|nr:hypothetical protein F3Y22_tig00113722pilonHSYRG00338 [Hibiscus syriacus]
MFQVSRGQEERVAESLKAYASPRAWSNVKVVDNPPQVYYVTWTCMGKANSSMSRQGTTVPSRITLACLRVFNNSTSKRVVITQRVLAREVLSDSNKVLLSLIKSLFDLL